MIVYGWQVDQLKYLTELRFLPNVVQVAMSIRSVVTNQPCNAPRRGADVGNFCFQTELNQTEMSMNGRQRDETTGLDGSTLQAYAWEVK